MNLKALEGRKNPWIYVRNKHECVETQGATARLLTAHFGVIIEQFGWKVILGHYHSCNAAQRDVPPWNHTSGSVSCLPVMQFIPLH